MGLTKNKLIIGLPGNEKYAKLIDRTTFKAFHIFLTDGQYRENVFIYNEIPNGSHRLFTCKTTTGEEIILNTAWIIKAVPVIYDVFRVDVSNDEYYTHDYKPDADQIVIYEFACVYTENTEVEVVDEYIPDCKKGHGKVVNRQTYCENVNNLKQLTY